MEPGNLLGSGFQPAPGATSRSVHRRAPSGDVCPTPAALIHLPTSPKITQKTPLCAADPLAEHTQRVPQHIPYKVPLMLSSLTPPASPTIRNELLSANINSTRSTQRCNFPPLTQHSRKFLLWPQF